MKRIAVILAHPDDAEIWVGGTILNHISQGDKIHIIYLFATNEERRKEAKLLNNLLNTNVSILDSNDMVRPILKDFNPDVIITHWEKDSHFEHYKTYDLVSNLIPLLILEDGLNFNFYSCDTYNSIGRCNEVFNPNVYVDISSTWLKKVKLIMNHKSQPTDYWISMIQNQNRLYGLRILSKYAEGFIQINTLGFMRNKESVLK